tara:strand:- start:70 stop:528 length:459 start_codon:yes stop_codon:yes gene_type:complete
MSETPKKKPDEVKKNLFQKFKEKIDDKEEQFEYISVAVRLLVVVWSGGLVTLNYLPAIPGISSGEKQDITFPASLLASSLSSFGLERSAKKRDDGTYKVEKEKKEKVEGLGNNNGVPYTIVRIETPVKLVPDKPKVDALTGKKIDPETGKLT